MAEKPILFKGEMVRAILRGDKTQTRRVISPQPEWWGLHPDDGCGEFEWKGQTISDGDFVVEYAPVSEGDVLWVRETFWCSGDDLANQNNKIVYDADENHDDGDFILRQEMRKRPSIFLPRWACRLLLRVVDVWVERVLDIEEADAVAEGVAGRAEFLELWDKINGKRGFGVDVNPWVWVYKFKVKDLLRRGSEYD